MHDLDHARLESLEVGPLPLIRWMLDALGVEAILQRHLPEPARGRPRQLAPARCIRVLLENILLSRQPLYAVPQWLAGFVPEQLGLSADLLRLFNDDRIGRELDRLFECDSAAVATDMVVAAVRRFGLRLGQLHNDSTTVTFHGKYRSKTGTVVGKQPPEITYGFNKDHRPDLKQLVFELSTTADGAVPVHFRVHDGNVTDDQTHRDTWLALRQLVGTADFLYVADSKLATSETLRFIDQQGGGFVSVLPRTRGEAQEFCRHVQTENVDFREVRRDKNPREPGKPIVYDGYESPQHSSEGFRILWYRSSQKLHDDQERRGNRLAIARMKISRLEGRLGRGRLRDPAVALAAAHQLLQELDVAEFLKVTVEERTAEAFEQVSPGRPGPNTRFAMVKVPFLLLMVHEDGAAVAAAARADGLFPLVTNHASLTLEQALAVYKHQPFLEKRHEQMKSVLEVAPVYLKSPRRVAALLLVYFLALLISALLERQIRQRMRKAGVQQLPLYPEERLCRAPTTALLLDAFRGLRRHRLIGPDGSELKTFFDPLSPVAQQLLTLLDIDFASYGPSA
jgi:transposase